MTSRWNPYFLYHSGNRQLLSVYRLFWLAVFFIPYSSHHQKYIESSTTSPDDRAPHHFILPNFSHIIDFHFLHFSRPSIFLLPPCRHFLKVLTHLWFSHLLLSSLILFFTSSSLLVIFPITCPLWWIIFFSRIILKASHTHFNLPAFPPHCSTGCNYRSGSLSWTGTGPWLVLLSTEGGSSPSLS